MQSWQQGMKQTVLHGVGKQILFCNGTYSMLRQCMVKRMNLANMEH